MFWRLAHGFFVAAEVAVAVFLGALSSLALRRLVLPRWLGWFTPRSSGLGAAAEHDASQR